MFVACFLHMMYTFVRIRRLCRFYRTAAFTIITTHVSRHLLVYFVCMFVRASVRSSESMQEYFCSFTSGSTVLHSEVLVFSGTFNSETQEENRYVVLREHGTVNTETQPWIVFVVSDALGWRWCLWNFRTFMTRWWQTSTMMASAGFEFPQADQLWATSAVRNPCPGCTPGSKIMIEISVRHPGILLYIIQ
jgi:hypothetical protein